MADLKLGILLWSQATDWPGMVEAAKRVDRLGYDHLWTWDHVYAIYGDPYQPIFEGWTVLGAWGVATERTHLGLLVGANTFRNPGLVAKMAATVDHISGGRAILGIGGAWFELEHEAHGIDFGSGFGERLDRLDEAAGVIRRVLDGEEVSHAGATYHFDRLRHAPRPLQEHLPIMIGGSGERKTLRTVARWADIWNAYGTPDELRRKDEVLRRHCEEVGRNESSIERTVATRMLIRSDRREAWRVYEQLLTANRTSLAEDRAKPWVGTPDEIAERIRGYQEIGFNTLIAESAAPYDEETIERLIGEVRPMVGG